MTKPNKIHTNNHESQLIVHIHYEIIDDKPFEKKSKLWTLVAINFEYKLYFFPFKNHYEFPYLKIILKA